MQSPIHISPLLLLASEGLGNFCIEGGLHLINTGNRSSCDKDRYQTAAVTYKIPLKQAQEFEHVSTVQGIDADMTYMS